MELLTMQESPTEKRLDRLEAKVDGGFTLVDERSDRVDERFVQMDKRFDRMELELRRHGNEFVALRAEIKVGFERMEERFDERSDATHRLLVQVSASLLGTVILASAGLVATQL
jgi:hypothetical protein